MGVRYGEGEWKTEVESIVARNKDKIDAVLADYNIPLLDLSALPARKKDDDD